MNPLLYFHQQERLEKSEFCNKKIVAHSEGAVVCAAACIIRLRVEPQKTNFE